jgi:hypothetical protein
VTAVFGQSEAGAKKYMPANRYMKKNYTLVCGAGIWMMNFTMSVLSLPDTPALI